MNLEYGKLSIDTATLPAASIDALLRKGWAHFMGNEQASKVTAWKGKLAEGTKAEGDVPAVAGREPSEAEIEAKKAEYQGIALQALRDGTVGVSVARGPAISPEEGIARQLARAEVTVILRENGLKVPTGEKTVTFGDGQKFTMTQLIDRKLEADDASKPYASGTRLRAEAAKELKRRERDAAKVKGSGIAAL